MDYYCEFTFVAIPDDHTFTLEEVANNTDFPYLADFAKFFLENPDAGAATCELMFKTEDGALHVFKEDDWHKQTFWDIFPFGVEDSGFLPNVSIDDFLIGATAFINRAQH